MGSKIVLILVALSFIFIAAISSADDKGTSNGQPSFAACNFLLSAPQFAANGDSLIKVYGQFLETMITNNRGEVLIISGSAPAENIAAQRPGAIPIDYVSFKIAKLVEIKDANELRTSRTIRDRKAIAELEPILMSVVLANIYATGVTPTYRPAPLRKSYLFETPDKREDLLAIEHIQHADSMSGADMSAVTAAIIRAFQAR